MSRNFVEKVLKTARLGYQIYSVGTKPENSSFRLSNLLVGTKSLRVLRLGVTSFSRSKAPAWERNNHSIAKQELSNEE